MVSDNMNFQMTERTLTVTEAARNFADLVNRVYYRGESALLLKNGTPVARIIPVESVRRTGAEIAAQWDDLPHLPPEEAEAFARDIEEARRELPPLPDLWE